jgi:peptidoglycan-associated lipoprotein
LLGASCAGCTSATFFEEIDMSPRWFGIVTALAVLAACSSAPPETSSNQSGNAYGAQGGSQIGGTASGVDASGGKAGPGSEEDLKQNVGDRVFFDTDQSGINAEGRKTLERQAQWLKRYPNLTVTIEGHCDERGLREYNLALGDRRATAAKDMLVALGIDARRIKTVSYGKERPAVVGSDESAWAQNRRAVTVVD